MEWKNGPGCAGDRGGNNSSAGGANRIRGATEKLWPAQVRRLQNGDRQSLSGSAFRDRASEREDD